MLLSRSPGQIPDLVWKCSTGLGYTFARVSLVLDSSVVAAGVEVFETSADSFGVTRI